MIIRYALDLFCGAGGAAMGLARAGYLVVGVDIAPQKNYPFPFIQADVMEIDFAKWDLVWASPPCQAYSKAQKLRKNNHPDLIVKVREKLKASKTKYVIENVEGAPLINPTMLCGLDFKELKTYRHRLFECNFPVKPLPHSDHPWPLAKMGRKPKPTEFMHVVGNFSDVKAGRQAMGISWMTRNELSEAIPPAFAEYIASNARGA